MKLLWMSAVLSSVLLSSCGNSEYIDSKLEVEEAGQCNGKSADYRMVSNMMGERYEFMQCLPEGFTKEQCEITRSGDTLFVSFPSGGGAPLKNYKLTLDIDAQPAYHFISLAGEVLAVVPSE